MKIAVNTRFLIKDQLEGIGWFTYETLKRITRQHPEHEFLFLFDRPYDEQFIFADNITPVVVQPPARHPLLWYYWFEVALPQVFDKHQPDLFLSPDGYLSLNADVNTLLVIHDLAFEHYPQDIPFWTRHFYRHFSKKYAQRADRIATVSKFSKQDIVEQYQVPGEKIDVVYDGVQEYFSPLSNTEKEKVRTRFSDGHPYFVYIGALHPRKNVSRLLKAFDRFKATTGSEVRLVIAGRKAWQTRKIAQTFDNMAYKRDVVFTGHLSDVQQVSRLLAGALSLVYVSKFEGFGLPLLEAMYCDVPVITSNITSMPEITGEAACHVDPFSVREMAVAMQQVYEDEGLRERLVRVGRKQRQRFSWERTSDKLWESIAKVCAGELVWAD